jgi:hypothetical protein
VILDTLREAAGPDVPIVGATLYDIFLAYWFTDPANAQLSVAVIAGTPNGGINDFVAGIYATKNVPVADVEGAFNTTMPFSVTVPPGSLLSVATICAYMACAAAGAGQPRDHGRHHAMALAFADKLFPWRGALSTGELVTPGGCRRRMGRAPRSGGRPPGRGRATVAADQPRRPACRSTDGPRVPRTWSDVDDRQPWDLDVVVILRHDRDPERDGGRGDPRVVDRHPQPQVAQGDAEARPRIGDALVDWYRLERERGSQRRQATIPGLQIEGCEHAGPQLPDGDDRDRKPIGQGFRAERPTPVSKKTVVCAGS